MERSFPGRRSAVLSRHGCVACTQPLAAEIGLQVLRRGGNAADAAVAVAAALNVTEPCSTGIGGDCFCLYYDAATKAVKGINGSGRCSSSLTLDLVNSKYQFTATNPIPDKHALNVTVPGAAAGWSDTIDKFGSGKFSLLEVLEPAIGLAEEGYPVAPIAALLWKEGAAELRNPDNAHGRDMLLPDGNPPRAGDIMKMPHLATAFKTLGREGKAGFYEGRIAEAIVECVTSHGGVMTLEDLREHRSTFDTPIKVEYRGIEVWEMPPNGQGITALMALNVLQGFDFKDMEHNSPAYLHLLIEALQLSFADAKWYCADPSRAAAPVKQLLSEEYATQRRQLIKTDECLPEYLRGEPFASSETVYFSVVDAQGNACSFINSNYMGFGTGLVPRGCGFTLHNRGANFSLDPRHPNVLAPGKRSYHTIIPGMATRRESGELVGCFGVMGGFMQPQGHVQVLLNMLEYGMNPQEALDAPRFCILPPPASHDAGGGVALEDGISEDTIKTLKALGHHVTGPVVGNSRYVFGRGQIITPRLAVGGERVWWAGSDGRGDGQAIGY